MAVFVFLCWLTAGLVLSLAVVPLGAEGRKFFLFNGALAFILGGISLLPRLFSLFGGPRPALHVAPLPGGLYLAAQALLAGYLVSVAFGRDPRILLRLAAAGAMLALVLDARALTAGARVRLPASALLHVLNAGTSGWLAGSILLAMILGHFYLVIPNLSIAPLRSLFRFSLFGLLARIAVVATAGSLWWQATGPGTLTAGTFLSDGVFVLQRVLFGLLIPSSLAWFTWKTIEMRSTQSATGILYVVVFLTLVGEALSVYLSLANAIPI